METSAPNPVAGRMRCTVRLAAILNLTYLVLSSQWRWQLAPYHHPQRRPLPLGAGGSCHHRTSAASHGHVGTGTSVAVIVNVDNTVDQLSLAELQRIVLGERRSWSTKIPVVLMMRNEESRERALVLQKVCHMTDTEYHQHWTGKIFRGEVTAGPVALPSVGTALSFVSSIKGVVSCVDAAGVHVGVKVLRIDGHLPGEHGYPLQ